MASFDLNSINSALDDNSDVTSGVDFSGKSLKLDTEIDAQPIVDAINACPNLQYLTLTGNTLGVAAAGAIAKALEHHPELKIARFSDMFTGRMKTEIPPALSALGDGMIAAGARLSVLDLSDNAFGPIGVEGLAKLLQSEVCSELEELRLNNNGLGITGGMLLSQALLSSPRKLRVFVAGRNRLENEGARALAAVFQNMGTLEELSMPQNGIYHAGVSALSAALACNPQLARLNLNDNTVGPKGAAAVADALPSLKNLKSINFGDCLLKSKGATALAKGLKDNSILLESLDLSCNEIGRVACMELVDAITALPDSAQRLTSVVLAGNSFGGSENKNIIKEKLGECARLDDDDSEEEYVSGSEHDSDEEEDENSEENENSEDSAPEDAQHFESTSGAEVPTSDAARFLNQPTLENLAILGPNAADVLDAHLQSIQGQSELIHRYVEAFLCVAGLASNDAAADTARRMCRTIVGRAGRTQLWPVANMVLEGLGLIKSEKKNFKIKWRIASCFAVLATEINAPYFPPSIRETLKYFIGRKMGTFPPEVLQVVQANTCLFTL